MYRTSPTIFRGVKLRIRVSLCQLHDIQIQSIKVCSFTAHDINEYKLKIYVVFIPMFNVAAYPAIKKISCGVWCNGTEKIKQLSLIVHMQVFLGGRSNSTTKLCSLA